MSLLSVALGFAGAPLGRWAIERHLADVERAAAPLLAAVESFEADNGKPPINADLLVPRYLDAIPATGLAADRAFRYSRDPGRGMTDWSVAVRLIHHWYGFGGGTGRWVMTERRF